jgi:uncharacterized protein
MAGNFEEEMQFDQLSIRARKYIKKAFKGISGEDFRDYHVHILGIGTGKTGNFIHPKMASWMLPTNKLKFNFYSNAAGITNLENSDQQYLARLVQLTNTMPGKFSILAWDKFYNKNGTVNADNTLAYVPNDLIYEICLEFPDLFIPCISIHPYRKNAIKELSKWAGLGVRQVKWAPNSMGIDASDIKCIPFYEKLVEYNMTLLTHSGKEEALPLNGYQHLGNPLLFRRPLEMGVKIVMAHCAGLGSNIDLDNLKNGKEKNYKLFLRLMDEKQFSNNLFGDIAGFTQLNRCGKPLRTFLKRTDLHSRLINGSDYPLPAINSLIWTRALEQLGYITKNDRKICNEIYKYNPLLFDFVLKRCLKHPKTGDKFSEEVFCKHHVLEPAPVFV